MLKIVKPINYTDYLVTYRQKAGDIRYERGLAFMQRYTKQSYKDAYREFQQALHFNPGDTDAKLKRDEAYEYAVTNVVVLPMQQQGGYVYSSYNIGGNNLDDQLLRSLQYYSGNEFVKFYSAWDARSRQIRVDQEVLMQLGTIDIGRQHDNRSNRKVSKEIVVKEIVYRPDSIVKEYARVHANIITTRRTMSSNVMLQVNIRDADGRWLWNDNFTAQHNWVTEFATYNGDERALSDSDKLLVNRRQEFAPTESEIMRLLLEEIRNNAEYRIKNYFNRF